VLVLVGTELKAGRARDEADKRALRHTGGGIRAVTRPGDDGASLGPGVHSALHKEIEALLAGEALGRLACLCVFLCLFGLCGWMLSPVILSGRWQGAAKS
jgi:hypothetical protein